ncbi:MAG TPA: hypothetical protein PLE13_03015, partial [Solirubrobacterales bacterium]|nr:hypothetical protein [Solirubrobacterales bacterium]HNK33934.1 hypothetical protein [Solirubrobacterales bacterium]HNK66862.1 hypothetical protein [Solirubrobacterales bacterium]
AKRIEPAGRRFSRRMVIGATAASVLGLALDSNKVQAAQARTEQISAQTVEQSVKPLLQSFVVTRRSPEFDELPPSLVRLAITEPNVTYDLHLRPNSPSEVRSRTQFQTNESTPNAAIQVASSTFKQIVNGTLELEIALAQNYVILSGDRRILAPFKRLYCSKDYFDTSGWLATA